MCVCVRVCVCVWGRGGRVGGGCGGETFPKVQVMFVRTIFLYFRENFFYKKVSQSAAMK